jgi:hypothetical protein
MDDGSAYEFLDDALIDENGNSDAKDTNKKKIATTPSEIVFKILSSSSPIFNKFVLVCFHSSTHFSSSSSSSSISLSLCSVLCSFLLLSLQSHLLPLSVNGPGLGPNQPDYHPKFAFFAPYIAL